MVNVLVGYLTDPRLWLIVILISIFGVVEHLAAYYTARSEGEMALDHMTRITEERKTELLAQFNRWGALILTIASIPVLGLILTAIAGASRVGQVTAIILIVVSYLTRNWLIVIFAGQIVNLFF